MKSNVGYQMCWTNFWERIREDFFFTFLKKWADESLELNFQRMRSLYTRSTNGPLVFNLLAYSKCKAQSLISQGPYGDMSSNDMSCDDVSPSDTSSFSIKWYVWYNRYYISILSSFLMKCHQMTCHHLPRHRTCHVITWHVINDDKLKPVLIPVM